MKIKSKVSSLLIATLLITSILSQAASALSITSISPASGPIEGGNTVTIKGDFVDDIKFSQINAGYDHTIALGRDGEVYAWGRNNLGQLGDGAFEDKNVPSKISKSFFGNKKVMSIVAGGYHNVVLTEDGNLYTWGAGQYGQLGDGYNNNRAMPIKIDLSLYLQNDDKVKQVSGGMFHTVMVTKNNEIFTWGGNSVGQLGNNSTVDSNLPVKVFNTLISSSGSVKSVLGSWSRSSALMDNGDWYSWGYNNIGQFGNGTTGNSRVPVISAKGGGFNSRLKSVSGMISHAFGITSDDKFYGWGYNISSQVGDGQSSNVLSPVEITSGCLSGKKVVKAEGGTEFSLALTDDNKLCAWGKGEGGRLGSGLTNPASTPIAVSMPEGLSSEKIVGIKTGYKQSRFDRERQVIRLGLK